MVDSDGVLRIGLALLFLWFGVNQVVQPMMFAGYPPSWIGLAPTTLVYINGVFELVTGSLLLLGVWTPYVAGLLAVHLLGIVISLGYNPVAVRDAALTVALVAVALNGHDDYSVQHWL